MPGAVPPCLPPLRLVLPGTSPLNRHVHLPSPLLCSQCYNIGVDSPLNGQEAETMAW